MKKFEGGNMLSEDDGKYLLSVAKDAIETYVKKHMSKRIEKLTHLQIVQTICMRNLEFLSH